MTPIESALNIGPVSSAELRSIGIDSVEALEDLGWEEAYERWVQAFPDRIHTMAARALFGAAQGVSCLTLSEAQKKRVASAVRRLKAEMR